METRPLRPERVKHFIARKAAERYAGRTASAHQRGLVAGMLKQCFAEFDDADSRRHSVQFYLTGLASLTNVPDPIVLAMLDWLGPVRDESGAYQPGRAAVAEARAIEHAYLLSETAEKYAVLGTALRGEIADYQAQDGQDWQDEQAPEPPPHF